LFNDLNITPDDALLIVDARKLGFEVVLISDATRPVNAANGRVALATMRAAGVRILEGPQSSGTAEPDAPAEIELDEPEACRKAPVWAEHQRLSDSDMPCDDGRAV
jgi:hypothetical protein